MLIRSTYHMAMINPDISLFCVNGVLKMKKTFSFALICILSAVLFCACDPGDIDLLGDTEDTSGNTPYSDGLHCWKVSADKGDGLNTTEYWWDYEVEVKRTIKSLEEDSGGTITYSYSKVENKESMGCAELNNAAKEDQ